MAKRVRLIDIARRLDITKVSVSKALRDHPDISRETRELVKKTAEEMGYFPDLLARSLSSQRSLTLGIVVPKIAHTFFAAVIHAVQEEATKAGYGIVLAVSNESAELERRHIERLLSMRVDGLLVSVSKEEPDLSIYEQVRSMNVPLVFFDRPLRGMGFSSVTVNDRRGAYLAAEALIAKGFTKIAHVAGTQEVEIGRERRAGFEDALRTHNIPLRPEWVIDGGFDEWHGYNAFLEMLRSEEVPEAVFAVTFPSALGIHGAINEHAPHLAGKVEIAAFGQGGPNEFFTFTHLCVRQPAEEMGRHAFELLLERITADETPEPKEIVLETDLVGPQDIDVAATAHARP